MGWGALILHMGWLREGKTTTKVQEASTNTRVWHAQDAAAVTSSSGCNSQPVTVRHGRDSRGRGGGHLNAVPSYICVACNTHIHTL